MSGEVIPQNTFISKLIESKILVSVFLTNGIKLTGVLTGVDRYTFTLHNTNTQLIFKSAVSTISPSKSIE